jgi:DNA-binding transcriptional regulator YiaG
MALERCEVCQGRLRRRVVPAYRDARLGLPGVVLVGAVTEFVCPRGHGVAGISIPNLDGAIAAAGVARVMHPLKLSGDDLRALRRACGWSAKELAELLGVRAETVSRWETGAETIGPANEKLIRLVVGHDLAAHESHLVPFDSEAVIAMDLQAGRSAARRLEIRLALVRVDDAASAGAWEQAKKAA